LRRRISSRGGLFRSWRSDHWWNPGSSWLFRSLSSSEASDGIQNVSNHVRIGVVSSAILYRTLKQPRQASNFTSHANFIINVNLVVSMRPLRDP
jgi:hypothetical protein